jgi:hypothetical protein
MAHYRTLDVNGRSYRYVVARSDIVVNELINGKPKGTIRFKNPNRTCDTNSIDITPGDVKTLILSQEK